MQIKKKKGQTNEIKLFLKQPAKQAKVLTQARCRWWATWHNGFMSKEKKIRIWLIGYLLNNLLKCNFSVSRQPSDICISLMSKRCRLKQRSTSVFLISKGLQLFQIKEIHTHANRWEQNLKLLSCLFVCFLSKWW